MIVKYYEKYFTGTKDEVEKEYKAWRETAFWVTIVDYDAKQEGDILNLIIKYSVAEYEGQQ